MMYLKYADYSNNELVWSESMSFNPLSCIEKINTERKTGATLRRFLFSHLIAKRKKWEICISTDELMYFAQLEFIINFYSACAWKISFDNWTNSIVVVLDEQGDIPIELLSGNIHLKEIQFNLSEKQKEL